MPPLYAFATGFNLIAKSMVQRVSCKFDWRCSDIWAFPGMLQPRGQVLRRTQCRAGRDLPTLTPPLRRPARAMKSSIPRLVAFDLDGTLWWPEMYMLRGGAPFKKEGDRVYDRSGEEITLLGASREILAQLASDPEFKQQTQVAYVSRTEYPEWAIPCLKAIEVLPGLSMWDLQSYSEIFPGSKRIHFKNIQCASGIPYEDMLFFDNESWNIRDCSPLGITCVYTPDGMTKKVWEQGLLQFAKQAAKR